MQLRLIQPDDAEQLHHKYFCNEFFKQFYRPYDKSVNLESTKLLIDNHCQIIAEGAVSYLEYGFFDFNDHLIGLLTLDGIDLVSKKAELLFGLFTPGLGIRSGVGEAILLALIQVFNRLGFHKLCANVYSYNPRAIKSIADIGFKAEGVLRQHLFIKNKGYVDVHVFGLLLADVKECRAIRLYQKRCLGYIAF